MIALMMVVGNEFVDGTTQRACPTKIIRSRHSSLIERTKRSANAFKLGDRGGYRVTAVLDSAIRRRNCAVYFVSRSTINWVLSAKQPAN